MGVPKRVLNGWKEKKVLKEERKSTKVIEKVIEKQSEQEAKNIVTINDVANKLLKKVAEATEQLNIHMDMFGVQHESIIDRADIKKLTSALKDLQEIIPHKDEEDDENSFIEALNNKTESVWNEEKE